jgi:hypothetical protein
MMPMTTLLEMLGRSCLGDLTASCCGSNYRSAYSRLPAKWICFTLRYAVTVDLSALKSARRNCNVKTVGRLVPVKVGVELSSRLE